MSSRVSPLVSAGPRSPGARPTSASAARGVAARGPDARRPGASAALLSLQRTAGNRAVARMLTARPPARRASRVLARVLSNVADAGQTTHVTWGNGTLNTVAIPAAGDRPIVIEVMETDVNSAIAKVQQVAAVNANANASSTPRMGIAIAFNGKNGTYNLQNRTQGCATIAQAMLASAVPGACFPALWSSTTDEDGGYTFPFLEMRARTTLHQATQSLFALFQNATGDDPIVRGMDADVTNDPLLEGGVIKKDTFTAVGPDDVLSGGYEWDASALPPAVWGVNATDTRLAGWNRKWNRIIRAVNAAEHERREYLNEQGGAQLLYWAEPNIYMTATTRTGGAQAAALKAQQTPHGTAQMRESVFYLRSKAKQGQLKGTYRRALTTVKPAKAPYFVDLRALIMNADNGAPSDDAITTVLTNIRQTHLNPDHVGDIQKQSWYGVEQAHYRHKDDFEENRIGILTELVPAVRDILGS